MSPNAMGRLWSFPLIALAVLASLLVAAPAAHAAAERVEYFTLTYDCLKGQSITFTPGKAQVKLSDDDGKDLGYADIVKAELGVFPLWMSDEGSRYQLETNPGAQTNFHPEENLLLSDEETVWFTYRLAWNGSGNASVEYQPSSVECTGSPTDTDGDGVPDELDVCVNEPAAGSSDGCPPGLGLEVVNVTAGNLAEGVDGSAEVRVTNVADGAGRTEAYEVWFGEQTHSVTLTDGTSASVVFTGAPGDWSICARSTTRGIERCLTANVPDEDAVPAYGATVVYKQTCVGLQYTITNTGLNPLVASAWLTHLGSRGRIDEYGLAPGASRTVTTPRYFNATIRPTVYATDSAWEQVLPSKRWVVPSTCPVPMVGGTKLIKWGPRVVRSGLPYAIVRTKAYHALVGYQVKGRSRIHWVSDYDTQGRHRFGNFLRIRPHKRVTLRLWVVYIDDAYIRSGRTVFTNWHTFRRP